MKQGAPPASRGGLASFSKCLLETSLPNMEGSILWGSARWGVGPGVWGCSVSVCWGWEGKAIRLGFQCLKGTPGRLVKNSRT